MAADTTPWLNATFLPVSLFSLKSALATSSGGKAVLVPTPYALKMALLSNAIRQFGLDTGMRLFPLIRDLRVALLVPERLVVIHGFGRVRRPWEPPKQKNADIVGAISRAKLQGLYPWSSTIAYREYIQFGGPLSFGLSAGALADESGRMLDGTISRLLLGINYLGRRGGFLQLAEPPRVVPELPPGMRILTDTVPALFGPRADEWTLQVLDDCGPALTFEHVNVYSPKRMPSEHGRVLRHVPLPLRLVQSSRSFSEYERIEPEEENERHGT